MAGEGLNSSGFTKKTLTVIQTEITQALQSAFGPQINLLAGSVFATVRDIFSSRESLVWDQLQNLYNSQYPDTATGNNLDNVCAITNTTRLPASKSKSNLQACFGTAGTLVPAGTQFYVSGNVSALFSLDTDVTLVAGANEVQQLAFSATPTSGSFTLNLGSQSTVVQWNATASQIQIAVQALPGYAGVLVTGSFASGFTLTYATDTATGNGKRAYNLPTITLNTLSNGTSVSVTPSRTTAGVNQGLSTATANATGPTVAPAGTLSGIQTPVTGLSATVNLSDAVIGANVETDSALRIRRKSLLQNPGATVLESIRSKLLLVSSVTQAIVFENTTLVVDGNGTPAKGIQCFVQGGADQDIANAIWLAKGAGIQTGGTVSMSVTDSQGIVRSISFSRPVQTPIYVTVTITKNSAWPSDGVTQVQNAILAYAQNLGIGTTVLPMSKLLPAIADAVLGIQNISIAADTVASPTNTGPIAIAVNAIATFATANMVINVS